MNKIIKSVHALTRATVQLIEAVESKDRNPGVWGVMQKIDEIQIEQSYDSMIAFAASLGPVYAGHVQDTVKSKEEALARARSRTMREVFFGVK